MNTFVVRDGATYRHIGADGAECVVAAGETVELPDGAAAPAELMAAPQSRPALVVVADKPAEPD